MSKQDKSPETPSDKGVPENKSSIDFKFPEYASGATKTAGRELLKHAEKDFSISELAKKPKEMDENELKSLVVDKINNHRHVPIVDCVKKLKDLQKTAGTKKLEDALKALKEHSKIASGKVTISEQEELETGVIFEKIYNAIWEDDCNVKLKAGLRLTDEKIDELVTKLKNEAITLDALIRNLDDANKWAQRIEKILK